jgi:WD40 repeat protein
LNPMTVYSITSDRLSPSPSAIMSMNAPDLNTQSAVYGISRAPLASPWGSSPQILVSGWYDGQVRCYDLRSHSRVSAATDSNQTLAPLLPVLSLFDPRSFEPIYSVSCGGGSSSHIAAGSARHGVISFWDVRSPRAGWSVYAPGNDPSPVYSVIVESSRVFGATQSRPFVYDFVS